MNRAGHFEAFKAAIPSPVAAHDSTAPLAPDKSILRASYAVLYDVGTVAPPDDERLTAPQRSTSKVTWQYVVKSVGTSPFAARSVDSAVADGLVGKPLTVTGRKLDPIRLDDVGPVKEDTDVSPPLYFIESVYLLRSQPA
mgnify:CR=1 FL=1